MKNLFITIVISVIAFLGLDFNNVDSVCPEPATLNVENSWFVSNIYEISIVDGAYEYNGKEILLNNDCIFAINKIKTTDNVSYAGQIDILVKYIEDEDLYICNLFDDIE